MSPDSSDSKDSARIRDGKRRRKGRERDLELDDFVTPKEQAEELGALMRRSLQLYEFKERRLWDESLDTVGESERRVRVVDIGEGVEDVVGEWVEESLGD